MFATPEAAAFSLPTLIGSRPLPRPLVIPDVMTLATLADVQALMRPLPDAHRERPTWRHVAAERCTTKNGLQL